jgi:hypothetical protein
MSAFSLTLDGEPFGVAIVTVHGVVTNSLIAGTHLTGGVVWKQEMNQSLLD